VALRVLLRQLRRQSGLTQRALSRPLYLASHSSIVDYESGRRLPPQDIVVAYERYFALPDGQLQRLRNEALAIRAAREAQAALAAVPPDRAQAGPASPPPASGPPASGPPDQALTQPRCPQCGQTDADGASFR
jgi:hypothetical protein